MDIMEAEPLVRYLIRNVSPHLKDDCYQAAFVGVLEAAKKYDPKKSKFTTYLNNHKGYIKHQILKEVAKLSLPFSIGKTTFLNLNKYKRGDCQKMSDRQKLAMEKLSYIRQFSYDKESEA